MQNSTPRIILTLNLYFIKVVAVRKTATLDPDRDVPFTPAVAVVVDLPNPPLSPCFRRQGPHRDVLPRLLKVTPYPEPLAVQVGAQPRARGIPVFLAIPRLLAQRHVRREDVVRPRRSAVLARRSAVAASPRSLSVLEVRAVHERVDPAPVELDAILGVPLAVEVRTYALDLRPPEEVAVLATPASSLAIIALEDDIDVFLECGLGRADYEEAALDSRVLLATGVDLWKLFKVRTERLNKRTTK